MSRVLSLAGLLAACLSVPLGAVEAGDKNLSRRMAEVIGPVGAKQMPSCRGRRPHLRDMDPNGCTVDSVRPIALGASNLWFPVLISALSVPQAADDLGRLVEDNWAVLGKATSIEILSAFRQIGQLKDFSKYNDQQIWQAIQKKNEGGVEGAESPNDLKSPEWKVFSLSRSKRLCSALL